jgi:hypothetical protein
MKNALLVMMLCGSVGLGAADLSGTWTLEFKPDFSGNPASRNCTFAQKGDKLTIDCGGQKMRGEVKGRSVAFQHKTGRENEITVTYNGTVDEHGTAIRGAWHLSPGDRKGDFEARKR